jgi:S-adenosylmethionine synthetase
MVRLSEMVLAGHPDKVCDAIADAVLMEAYRADPQAYGQVEVACWCDEFFLTGGIATRQPVTTPLEEVVRRVGRRIGYHEGNAVDSARWQVRNTVCLEVRDPREWTEHVNDQCIVVGYAGYGEATRFLPPEHYVAHRFRERLTESLRSGHLAGQGPDGKLIVRMREEGSDWHLEHVLVTIQQLDRTPFADVCAGVLKEVEAAYREVRRLDGRWRRDWEDVEVLVNPNGPLVNGGPDGDNGQTGRKLVMDYYGPRVPLGGGALSGKDLTHIDRAGAYAARQAAVEAVAAGAKECLLRIAYAPNLDAPLDVVAEFEGTPIRIDPGRFDHRQIREQVRGSWITEDLARGGHFDSMQADWNRPRGGILSG